MCCAGRWTPELATPGRRRGPGPAGRLGHPGATAPGLVVRVGPVGSAGPGHLVHTPEICPAPASGGLLHLEAPDAAVDLHTPEPELRRWAASCSAGPAARSAASRRAASPTIRSASAPCPPTASPSSAACPAPSGLYVAVTHSGVTLAAHLSRLIAAELTTGAPPADLAPYRPDRFLAQPSSPLPRNPRSSYNHTSCVSTLVLRPYLSSRAHPPPAPHPTPPPRSCNSMNVTLY